jgi:imidazolonepropionase-like amidohydrolase
MNGVNFKEAVKLHQNGVQDAHIHKVFQTYLEKDIHFLRDGGDNLGVTKRAKELSVAYDIDYRTSIFAIHKNGYYGRIVGFGFDTITEYRDLVNRAKKEGADFIKIMCSGILDFDVYGKVSTPLDDFSVIREMVHIAHEEGFAVMAHVNTPKQIKYALEAGTDSIEHGYYMDEECMDIMLETGAVWVPTVTTVCNLIGTHRFDEENVKKIAQSHLENVNKAVRKGVLLAVGSDAGAICVPHAQGTLDEVKWLKQAVKDDSLLLPILVQGEAVIREKFRRC